MNPSQCPPLRIDVRGHSQSSIVGMVANDSYSFGYLEKSVGDMVDKGLIIDEQLRLVRAHSARRATRKNESLDMIHHHLRLKAR
jgi:hypothetical protein